MNAEFNWWLLIVGLVVGAGLVWLVVLDSRRRESDVDAAETAREALWLSTILAEESAQVTPATAHRLLELHRAYLGSPPPDDPEALIDDDVDGAPIDADERLRDAQDWPSSTGSARSDSEGIRTTSPRLDDAPMRPGSRPADAPPGT